MINLHQLRSHINTEVDRVFLIVFPPFAEESLSAIDIRLGLVLRTKPENLVTIGTNMNDIWTPVVGNEIIPSIHFYEPDFEERMLKWQTQNLNTDIILEYYEMTKSNYFKRIVGKKIEAIELVLIEGNPEPFGLKFLFEDDFIIVFPNFDGSSIETKYFNKNNDLKKFDYLGNVIYLKA